MTRHQLCWAAVALCVIALAAAHGAEDFALKSKGAKVTASSELGNFKGKKYLAAHTIDGGMSGPYWCTNFTKNAKPPHTLTVDLGRVRTVGRVRLHMYKRDTHLLKHFIIEVQVGGAWRQVAEQKAPPTAATGLAQRYESQFGVFEGTLDPPLNTQRVRLTVLSRGIARLHEIEVLPPARKSAVKQPELKNLSGGVLKFDFGSAASPVAEGWIPVTAKTKCDDAHAYGWDRTDGLISVDRTAGYDVTRDFVAGVAGKDGITRRFCVRLPPGNYAVAVISGDLSYPVPAFTFATRVRSRRRKSSRMGTGGRGGWCTVRRFMDAEYLHTGLQCETQGAFVINAVIIAPTASYIKVHQAVEEIEDQFAKGAPELIKRFPKRPQPEQRAAPEITAYAKKHGLEVFSVPMAQAVLPWTLPKGPEVVRELAATVTPGEREPITFAVRAYRPVIGLELQVSDLRSEAGDLIVARDRIKIGLVRCWPQVTRKWQRRPAQHWIVPEMIEPCGDPYDEVIWMDAHTTRQVWMTVDVPPEAKPGTYRGKVTVQGNELPVALRVLPFKLRWPEEIAWGIYYYPSRVPDDKRVLADLRDLRSNGLDMICLSLGGKVIKKVDGEVQIDFTQLRRSMGLMQKVGGFKGPFPVYCTSGIRPAPWTEDKRVMLQQVIRAMEAERKKQGWPEILYYLQDEPFRGKRLDEAVPLYQAAKEIPGIRTYCTVSAEAAERLAPWLDVRTHSPTVYNGFTWPKVRDSARKDGDTFWFYTNATRSHFDVMRMKAGFFHWKIGATGQSYWHYRAPVDSPFCDFDGGSRDHMCTYPGLDGPIRTVQWECHREGVDDARYAYTLEATVADAKKRKAPAAAIARAEETLDALRKAINVDLASYAKKYPKTKYAFHFHCDWKPEEFDTWRARIVKAILDLRAAMREKN